MLDRVLPKHFDNTFRGPSAAIWIFVLILLVKTAQSASVLFAGTSIVTGADGIPLDTYSPSAAQTLVSVWTLLGLSRLVIYLLSILVVFRYRSMMTLMFALLLLYDVGRHLVLHHLPIERVGTPPGPIVNNVLMGLTCVGFVLALLPGRRPAAQPA